MNAPVREITVERIERARAVVAELLMTNPAYAPLFQRLDAEVSAAIARANAGPIERARLMVETLQAESDPAEQP